MLTRIMRLPKHDAVIIGRDLSNTFEPGMIYDVKNLLGEIILTPLGVTSLSEEPYDYPNVWGSIESIMYSSDYLITTKERERFENYEDD